MGSLGPRGVVGKLLRFGPHGPGLNPLGGGVTLNRLDREVSGVDLGPLTPALPERLHTKDKRIKLTPKAFVGDLPRLRKWMDASRDRPSLTLIGRRELRSNNSWMHNAARLMKGADRCTLLMHPDDAAARSLATGQVVTIASRTGEVKAPVETVDDDENCTRFSGPSGDNRAEFSFSVAFLHKGLNPDF